MKIIFYGTPEIAVPYLDLLAQKETVVAVVTNPDKPAGRHLELTASPVKKKALELGIKVFQPERSADIAATLQGFDCDLAVVVAYGKILKKEALAIPHLGTMNVHFSILPKYRGAAPVAWSLVRGETKTGVTLFWLDEGMDSGPVFLSKEIAIDPDEDVVGLSDKLKCLGVEALNEVLSEIKAGRIARIAQTGEMTLAPKIKKEDGRLSFDQTALEIHNRVRGLCVWPRAYFELIPGTGYLIGSLADNSITYPVPGIRVIVLKTRVETQNNADSGEAPGTIVRVEPNGGILVKCSGSSRLWLLTVQLEGKRPVAASDFLNGLRYGPGQRLKAV